MACTFVVVKGDFRSNLEKSPIRLPEPCNPQGEILLTISPPIQSVNETGTVVAWARSRDGRDGCGDGPGRGGSEGVGGHSLWCTPQSHSASKLKAK